jgi:predicted NUDIX family NTP pyrophosphohydrolase
MGTQDEYRRNAAEAKRQEIGEVDRASWLRVAEGWLGLLKKPPQTLEDTFDKAVADKGTGQDDTKSSN